MATARLGRLLPGSSVLFLCDLQERFRGSIVAFPQIVAVAARLLQGCDLGGFNPKIWGLPRGFGVFPFPIPQTLSTPGFWVSGISKSPKFTPKFGEPPKQTALDLLEQGLDVHVAERALALARLRQAGAFLSTCESLLLLLLRDAAHPQFRQILPLIKEPLPDTGLILGGPLGVLGGL
ncbi:ISOC2 protein, partial [Eulacestoma nigropectus]|nr:ISOC2 protein [Eulacestoma nigropectus]